MHGPAIGDTVGSMTGSAAIPPLRSNECVPDDENGPDAALTMFTTCHERIMRECAAMPGLLSRLALDDDTAARDAAARVVRFFDGLAVHHHEDEERDLFPALIDSMAGSDAVCLRELTQGLTAEHRALDAAWEPVRSLLERAVAGESVQLPSEEVDAFAALHQRHIECEERELLPMAARLIADDELTRIGRAMRARRA